MAHADLLAKAKAAIAEVFSDTTVGKETTRESLEELAADIEGYEDTLGEGE